MKFMIMARNAWARFCGGLARILELILEGVVQIGSFAGGGGILSNAFVRKRKPEKLIRSRFLNLIRIEKSPYSQINADLFARMTQELFSEKINKNFVEAGACDGIINSNTKYLEEFGWNGILVEPIPGFHAKLVRNRTHARSYNVALHAQSNLLLDFIEASNLQLSSFTSHRPRDLHENHRMGNIIQVKTLSLHDLFQAQGDNYECDYLSLDLEGAEYLVLKKFFSDADKRLYPKIITVEHNYSKNRGLIKELLSTAGYTQVLRFMSGHDSWWILDTVLRS